MNQGETSDSLIPGEQAADHPAGDGATAISLHFNHNYCTESRSDGHSPTWEQEGCQGSLRDSHSHKRWIHNQNRLPNVRGRAGKSHLQKQQEEEESSMCTWQRRRKL